VYQLRNAGRLPGGEFMRIRAVRAFCVAACLFALAGCSASPSSFKLGSLLPGGADDTPPPPAASPGSDVTGSIAAPGAAAQDPFAVKDALLGGDPTDDLTLGKRHYRERNYGLAEKHFRRAVESLPRDGEAWLGLAASYDRLKRYELADRAYREALSIFGPRPEVMNNIGYSYMLRGDLRRAKQKFIEAQTKDPQNPTIANNIALVDEAARRKKGLN
jgi:tetratricopeptide (TPR) repeat protein